jgi:hypothetical protein
LDPLNWRHYFLLLYWVFFRPTALKCYLYRAEPELYRSEGGGFLFGQAFISIAYWNVFLITWRIWAVATLSFVIFNILLKHHSILTSVLSQKLSQESFVYLLGQATAWLLGEYFNSGFGAAITFAVVSAQFLASSEGLPIRLFTFISVCIAFTMASFVPFSLPLAGPTWLICWMAIGVASGLTFRLITNGVLATSMMIIIFLLYGFLPAAWGGLGHGDVFARIGEVYYRLFMFISVWGIGVMRIPLYTLQVASFVLQPWRLPHPLWWDELSVLPLWGAQREMARIWREGEEQALKSLVRLAANPFQYWVLQRALVRHYHTICNPIAFLYCILRFKALDTYAIAPVATSEWLNLPSVRQIYLAELAGSRSAPLQRQSYWRLAVYSLTRPLRLNCHTPLTDLAGLLLGINIMVDTSDTVTTLQAKTLLDVLEPIFFQPLLVYPGGSELQSTFACITHSLKVTSLSDFTQMPTLLRAMPSVQDAIRPEVIEILQRFGNISNNIAVAQAASSRLNQLAAFARATEALEELGPFIEQTVVVPEKVLLLRIRNHWRTLVAEAGGRLGEQVQHKRVVNPYVAGNPVKGGIFVGRDEILGQLEELWLKPGQVDSLVLYGHRRMGKSSILQNLPHRLDPATNWVVDFNLQTVNRSDTGSLLFDLASKMRDAVLRHPDVQIPASTSAEWTVPEESAFRANYQRAFSQWLDRLAPVVAGRRFIIAVDEYELLEEAMAEGSLDAQFTLYLRGVIQSREWFVLALAGLYTLQEQCHNYWHPLFASIKPRKVSFLSPTATRRLLTQPSDDFPLDYTPETLDAIYALTHGQPYLVQLIGQNLVAHYNRQVLDGERQPDQPLSLNDLEAIIASPEFFEDGYPYFSGVWAQAKDSPPWQHPVLYTLTAGPASLAHLAKLTALPVEDVSAALSTLEAHDVITIGSDGAYSFIVELMRRWVGQLLPPGSSSVS